MKQKTAIQLHIARRKEINDSVCNLLELFSAYLYKNGIEECSHYEFVFLGFSTEAIAINQKIFDEYIEQMVDTDTNEITVRFIYKEYYHYYLCSWIVRKMGYLLSDGGNLNDFFESNFNDQMLSYPILCCLQQYDKYLKDYQVNKIEFKSSIFNYMNECVSKKFFYDRNNQFDEEKMMLFINVWGIVKSYWFCQNPISSANKFNFTELIKDFFARKLTLKFDYPWRMNLAYMDFSEVNLASTVFYDVDFSYSNFYAANLDDITLDGSILSGANFRSAFMEVAGLIGCQCISTNFAEAHLLASVINDSDFTFADLRGTNLMECDARNLIIHHAKIDEYTAFNSTIFENVDWSKTDIGGASLSIEQIDNFWESVIGIRNTAIYGDDFKRLDDGDVQNLLYNRLLGSTESYLRKNHFPETKVDVFISHATFDKKMIAEPIYNYLIDNGYSVWIDNEDIKEEDKLRYSIEMSISNCSSAIIILSDTYKKRGWTKYEMHRLIQEAKKRYVNLILIVYNLTDIKDAFDNNLVYDFLSIFKMIIIGDSMDNEMLKRIKKLL